METRNSSMKLGTPSRRWKSNGSILNPNCVIAKDFKSYTYCCYIRYTTSKGNALAHNKSKPLANLCRRACLKSRMTQSFSIFLQLQKTFFGFVYLCSFSAVLLTCIGSFRDIMWQNLSPPFPVIDMVVVFCLRLDPDIAELITLRVLMISSASEY